MSTLKGQGTESATANDSKSLDEDDLSTIRDPRRSESGSTWGADGIEDGEEDLAEEGDFSYSSHMEEIFSDEGGSEGGNGLGEEEEEDFVYDGKDAEVPTGGYQEQLKDVLEGGSDGDSVDEAFNQSFSTEKSTHGFDQLLNGFKSQVSTSSTYSCRITRCECDEHSL